MEEKVKTGIDGLDNLLDGGFVRNRSILVQGNAGTGKTTLAIQFLVNGAVNFNEPGVILSMEYETGDLISDLEKFGWPLRKLIAEGALKIVTPPGGLENPANADVDDLINLLHTSVAKINAKRVVVDSLNSLEVSLTQSENIRRDLSRFITLVRDLDCTTIFISESEGDTMNLYSYITHGVINIFNHRVGANRLRAIEILKMRGINHSTLTHSMSITEGKGIEVLPHEIDLS